VTAQILQLRPRRRTVLDNARAAEQIAAAVAGLNRALLEIAERDRRPRFAMDADLTVYWPTVRPEWQEPRT
jgi:hypothetical protein